MNATTCLKTNPWIKTSDPVVPMNSSIDLEHLNALRAALAAGVCVDPDPNRPGFYDVQVDSRWFYIHIPRNLSRVYLISSFAAGVERLPLRSAPDRMYTQW
jgi:hypothetical protein